jgi:hypothetical protein
MSAAPERRKSWLPRDRPKSIGADAPLWIPAGFASERIGWAELSYIVVDELASEVAGLVVSSWPRLDAKGRVRHVGASWRVGARLDELRPLLEERKTPARTGSGAARLRPVRIGDAFAAAVNRPRGRVAAVPDLSRWLSPPIYDVSADARDAAKTALFGALAPKMSEDEVVEIAAEALDIES